MTIAWAQRVVDVCDMYRRIVCDVLEERVPPEFSGAGLERVAVEVDTSGSDALAPVGAQSNGEGRGRTTNMDEDSGSGDLDMDEAGEEEGEIGPHFPTFLGVIMRYGVLLPDE